MVRRPRPMVATCIASFLRVGLLTPPVRLHTRLLAHARSEGLKLTRAINAGRAASPVLSRDNPLDAIAGVIAALAGDFGVSDRFIAVRLEMYGLIAGGRA